MERTPGGALLLDGDQAQYDAEPTEALQFVEEGQDQRYAFARISHLILRDRNLSAYAKLAYCVARSFLGADGKVYPSYQVLADLCNCSRRKAIEAIQELVTYGLIAKEYRRDEGTMRSQTNVFRFADPLAFYDLIKPETSAGGALGSYRGALPPSYRGAPKEEVPLEEQPPNKVPPKAPRWTRKPKAEATEAEEQAWGEFRKAYPKGPPGQDVKKAREKFLGAIRGGEDPAKIIAGAAAYRAYCEAAETLPKHVKHMATFLGPNEFWKEEWVQAKPNGSSNGSGLDPNEMISTPIGRMKRSSYEAWQKAEARKREREQQPGWRP